MGQPFVGEIRMFGGNFAPAGWAFCDGRLLAISEFETLFNLIGTTYGGDGQSTFGLPDLQGRIPIHQGTVLGQTFNIGEKSGVESVTLTITQLPSHAHNLAVTTATGGQNAPQNNLLASSGSVNMYFQGTPASPMNANSISPTGGNQPHDNMMPFLVVSYIISLFGIFPHQ
jgi:microcystin-dependent protein